MHRDPLDSIFVDNFSKKPIDIVYTYVNPYDIKWKTKYEKYNKKKLDSTRFDFSDQQIKFSLQTIKKYASWINNIYIIHDDQKFELTDEWLKNRVIFIDHKDIIPHHILPTFNSIVIEAFLWNIPNLSDYFLYFNDDMFLGLNIVYEDLIDAKTNLPIQFYHKCRYYKHGWIQNIKQSNELFTRYFPSYNQHLCPQHAPYFLQKSPMKQAYNIFKKELETMFSKDKKRTYKSYVHNLIYLSAMYNHHNHLAINRRTSFCPILSLKESLINSIKNDLSRHKFYCFYVPIKTETQRQLYEQMQQIILS